MRDPYHNARLRFKVARDRFLKVYWSLTMRWWSMRLAYKARQDLFTPEYVVSFIENPPSKVNWLPLGPVSFALTTEWASPEYRDLQEAAGILHTMEKWGITDERRALMMYKLSRS